MLSIKGATWAIFIRSKIPRLLRIDCRTVPLAALVPAGRIRATIPETSDSADKLLEKLTSRLQEVLQSPASAELARMPARSLAWHDRCTLLEGTDVLSEVTHADSRCNDQRCACRAT